MSWSEIALGEVAEFRNGLNYTKANEGKGIKVINVKDFQDYFYPKYETLEEINPIGIVSEQSVLSDGDIVFVRSNGNKDLVGRSIYIDNPEEEISFSGFCIRARFSINENLSPKFYAHFFRSPLFRKKLSLLGSGTNISNLNQKVLGAIKIPVPPPVVQSRILTILENYNNLIENNRRRIQLLDQSARLLYKEWFVHLRFPGHEHVAIMDSVPEGWEIRRLCELADITMGQSPKSEYYNEDSIGLPFHQGVSNFGDRFIEHKVFCTIESRIAEPGDILFSVRAPVGRINLTQDKIVIGRGLSAIRSRISHQNFLFYQLKSYFFKEDMMGGGAIFAAITKNDLYNVELLTPSNSTIQLFTEHVASIDQQIAVLHVATNLLKQARDILLPRLMNGDIAV